MKARIVALAFLVSLAAFAAAAQPSFEVIARGTYAAANGDPGEFEDFEDTFSAEFDDVIGFGAALNFYFAGPWSVELGATFIEPDIEISIAEPSGAFIDDASVEMIPITLGLQYHFNLASRFDPYVGAGAGYILFDDIDDNEALADEDISVIEFDDTFGLMLNAGVNVGFFENFAFNIDVKYVDAEPDTSATFDRGDFVSEQSVEYSPVLVSAGVSWRF